MGFYVYRKYYLPQAKNYSDALDALMAAREQGNEQDFFVSTWAKDEKEVKGGWVQDMKKQLGGK